MLDPANDLRRTRMIYLITKALISGVIIMAASEAAKRSPTYGALLVSLPLISILAMIWLWRDTGDNERIAALSEGTFWLVLPTLPMFRCAVDLPCKSPHVLKTVYSLAA